MLHHPPKPTSTPPDLTQIAPPVLGTPLAPTGPFTLPAPAWTGAGSAGHGGIPDRPEALAPGLGRARRVLPLLGPAFVAAVAYVDPGNFATNLEGGAQFGYLLVWVLVLANVMAMLVQYLSAKLGTATRADLASVCRERMPRARWGLWIQAELVAMATDVAEFVGAALALQLLFGLPPLESGLVTAVIAFAMLGLRRHGHRRFEVATIGMLAVILAGFAYQLLLAPPDPAGIAGGLVPAFDGVNSALLASGIVGATVMPHVVYLHSALTGARAAVHGDVLSPEGGRRRDEVLRGLRLDIVVALGIAGLVNVGMLLLAASAFHGGPPVDGIEGVHAGLAAQLGVTAAVAFAVALLASGLSSSSVGTLAGETVMQGFLRRRIPVTLRRGITMAPALVVLGAGVDATTALVVSQVVLSFGIPFTLVPLVMLTARRDVMGDMVNRRRTTAAACLVAAGVIGLNVFLIAQVVTG